MNTFNRNTPCPKCGNQWAGIRYIETQQVIRRLCGCCSYSWNEAPLDSAQAYIQIAQQQVSMSHNIVGEES